jgi:hypothetical protein
METGIRTLQARQARGREPGQFLQWTCTLDDADALTLTTQWDAAAVAAHQEAYFGKTLLFTDHTDWDPAAIIAAYRGQGSLENGFRQMKDPHFVTFAPMFHWTDQKIRVHAPYCMLALLLTSLLHREARAAGFPGGLDALVETLADLKLVVDLPAAGRRERPTLRVTGRTPAQMPLFEHCGLAAYHAAVTR